MLNPVHLRTLVTVVRAGSFADAARTLGYTGSAVSQQIAALERAVQLPLFERTTHSIRPTPAARYLAEHARGALADLTALQDGLAGLRDGATGRVRIGSFPTASERVLPHALADLVERHPGIEIRLEEGEPDQLTQLLRDGALDVALVYRYDLVPCAWPHGIPAVPLLDEELVLLLPEGHELSGCSRLGVGDLREQMWVTASEGTAGSTCLERLCAAEGFQPSVVVRSNDYDVVRAFVRFGLGIALVPSLSHVPVDEVLARRLADAPPHRRVTVLHKDPRLNPAIHHLLAALDGAADRLAASMPGVWRAQR